MLKFLCKKNVSYFLGGVAASIIGKMILETKTVHDMTVKAVATGIKAKNAASEKIENIKEDAQDLVEESKNSSKDN